MSTKRIPTKICESKSRVAWINRWIWRTAAIYLPSARMFGKSGRDDTLCWCKCHSIHSPCAAIKRKSLNRRRCVNWMGLLLIILSQLVVRMEKRQRWKMVFDFLFPQTCMISSLYYLPLYLKFHRTTITTANLMVGMDLEGGRFFFNAVRGDGDSILYACDDENECSNWVMALYRATGQLLKPTPPLTHDKNSTISKIQGDADKARKHGMEDYISADPIQSDHHSLFEILQKLTLEYRLNDPYASLVSVIRLIDLQRSSICYVIYNVNLLVSFFFCSHHDGNDSNWLLIVFFLYSHSRHCPSITIGLVFSWSNICVGWILCTVRCAQLLSSTLLYVRIIV